MRTLATMPTPPVVVATDLRARRVLAVLGNHDCFTSGRGGAGAERHDVLRNQLATIDLDGAEVARLTLRAA